MKDNKSASLFPRGLFVDSLKQAFVKLNPCDVLLWKGHVYRRGSHISYVAAYR